MEFLPLTWGAPYVLVFYSDSLCRRLHEGREPGRLLDIADPFVEVSCSGARQTTPEAGFIHGA